MFLKAVKPCPSSLCYYNAANASPLSLALNQQQKVNQNHYALKRKHPPQMERYFSARGKGPANGRSYTKKTWPPKTNIKKRTYRKNRIKLINTHVSNLSIFSFAKIVAANFSCSAKFVFVKDKHWLCQNTEVSCNALVSVLRPYSKVNRLLRAFI